MRSAKAALAYSMAHPTIPYSSVSGIDGVTRKVDDLQCARSVMADFDVMPIADMGSANRMWARTRDKRTTAPLVGAPLYFPNARAGSSGHVALYAGGGKGWTTPIWLDGGTPYQGKELLTIEAIAKKCGNAYAGWGADIAGAPIDFTASAGGAGKPIDERKWDQSMGVMYYRTKDNKPDGAIVEWALAGMCPGTPSNWQSTTSQTTANQLAASGSGGSSVFAGQEWWEQLNHDFLAAPAPATGGASNAALASALAELNTIIRALPKALLDAAAARLKS